MRDRSALEPTRANREVYEAAARRRQGHVRRRGRWARDGDRARSSTGATRRTTTSSPSPVLGRRPAPHPALRPRLLRQRHPAGAARVQGVAQAGRAGVRREPHATTATRSRSSSCRTAFVILSNGSEAKVGATFAPWEHFGEWKRIDAEGERGRRRARDGDPRHCASRRGCSTSSRTSSPTSSGRAGWSRSLARNHQYSGVNAAIEALRPDPRDGRQAARRLLAHAGRRARASRCCGSRRRCCGTIPGNWTFVMVTDRDGARRPAPREFVDAGAVTERRTSTPTTREHLRELLARGPPLRLHADPQVPAARRARPRCRCSRIATT